MPKQLNYLETNIEILNKAIKTSRQLHEYMSKYNWDFGTEIPYWAIRNPLCDRGTALMIYWMAGAGYFCRYKSRDDIPSYKTERYDLILEIEGNYLSNFYTKNDIKFDPVSDLEKDSKGRNWVDEYSDMPQLRQIPAQMLESNRK
ncbi:MAG: DUF4274 domain-containing protein [Chloroflexi bacterium]|nr:DUF4274 domain-containing protein [Chloroflexota bacterium]